VFYHYPRHAPGILGGRWSDRWRRRVAETGSPRYPDSAIMRAHGWLLLAGLCASAGCSRPPGPPTFDCYVPPDSRVCPPSPSYKAIRECLMQGHCTGVEGCHGGDMASNFHLDYNGPYGMVGTPVYETSHEDAAPPDGGFPMYVRVVPGHPEESYLVWKLIDDPRIIGAQMPKGAFKDGGFCPATNQVDMGGGCVGISPAWLDAIETWIADGAPNN
jgi:hypothetical protein